MNDGAQFTYSLTNAAMTWLAAWGFKRVSIECVSATAGTVQGSAYAGGYASSALTLNKGDIQTFVNDLSAIDGLIITAPSGCTLYIIASLN